MLKDSKNTLVIGASTNPGRYSFKAINKLRSIGIETFAIGRSKGKVSDVEIVSEQLELENIHTVSMYISPSHQNEYYDYIINLKPKRIIFNPGTENPELASMAHEAEIQVLHACTLVMISTNQY